MKQAHLVFQFLLEFPRFKKEKKRKSNRYKLRDLSCASYLAYCRRGHSFL